MSKGEPPKMESFEEMAKDFMRLSDINNDKRISYAEFLSYVSKSKEILGLLNDFGLITKDDLRPNFGWNKETDLPDCDSDLEKEVLRKGANQKSNVDMYLIRPLVEVIV